MRPGKISDSVLKRSVLKQIRFRRQEVLSGAGIGEDCAIFAPSRLCASAVSQALVEEGADILVDAPTIWLRQEPGLWLCCSLCCCRRRRRKRF